MNLTLQDDLRWSLCPSPPLNNLKVSGMSHGTYVEAVILCGT